MKPHRAILQRIATALLVIAGLATTIATSLPPCEKHGDCENGQACLAEGYCTTSCESDDDCPDWESCSETGFCEWGCEDDEDCGITCENSALCDFDGQHTSVVESGVAEIDVHIGQSLFYTERPEEIRGVLRVRARGSQPEQASKWRLTMEAWGVDKEIDFPLQGTEDIIALEFGLDPSDEPCSIGEDCLLQFRLEQTGGPVGSVDVSATVSIELTAPAGFETQVEVQVRDAR